mgnify:CR=1 FL=1
MATVKNLLKSKLVVVGLVLAVLVVLWKMDAASWVFNRVYQAVFLTNNQVYFGRLSNQSSKFANLKDVYYLQITQAQNLQTSSGATSPNINLVKLGGELHGPTDKMEINRDHILFVETLKADSRVVTAISDYKKTQ